MLAATQSRDEMAREKGQARSEILQCRYDGGEAAMGCPQLVTPGFTTQLAEAQRSYCACSAMSKARLALRNSPAVACKARGKHIVPMQDTDRIAEALRSKASSEEKQATRLAAQARLLTEPLSEHSTRVKHSVRHVHELRNGAEAHACVALGLFVLGIAISGHHVRQVGYTS